MRLVTITALLLATGASLPHPAHAQAQTTDQRRCLTGSLKAGARVAVAQGRLNASCIRQAGKGKVASARTCLGEDAGGTVRKLAAKTVRVETKDCDTAPDFGWAGAAVINAAAVGEERALVSELIGGDVDGALLDGDAARCQWLVVKGTEKLAAAAVGTFRKCAKRGLADGTIASSTDLESCLDELASDARGRRAKRVADLAGIVAKKCDAVDLADAFPGPCAEETTSLPGCIDEHVTCRTCRMLDTMAALDTPCDRLDDGVENASCSVTATSTSTTTSTTAITLSGPIQGGCPASVFLDVSQAPGAGSGYADPELDVSCTGDEVVVRSNGIPHYTFVQITPNALFDHDAEFRFPQHPALAAQPSDIPLLGTVGVAVNGMPFFGPNEAAFPDPYGDPFVNAILDGCLGHTARDTYHYHALLEQCLSASGLVAEPWLLDEPSGDAPSPVLAYALDGFPVYGPVGCTDAACSQVIRYESSWENVGYESTACTSDAQCSATHRCALTIVGGVKQQACVPRTYAWDNNAYVQKTGAQYLDRCNGHVGPNGDYHYHATDTFPYILGCYAGTP